MRRLLALWLCLLCGSPPAQAATRFYFSNATAAEVSPAYDTGWTGTGSASRWKCATEFIPDETLASGTVIAWATSTGQQHLDRQYVSAPLAAQTISGTLTMQLKAGEVASTDNIDQLTLIIRVVNNLGNTYTGTVLALGSYGPTTEYSTRASNGDLGGRNKTGADGDALTSLAINEGDRLVIEIGHSNSTSGTTPNAYAVWGFNSVNGDYAADETDTEDKNGWIEFSGNLVFYTPVTTVQINGGQLNGGAIQ